MSEAVKIFKLRCFGCKNIALYTRGIDGFTVTSQCTPGCLSIGTRLKKLFLASLTKQEAHEFFLRKILRLCTANDEGCLFSSSPLLTYNGARAKPRNILWCSMRTGAQEIRDKCVKGSLDCCNIDHFVLKKSHQETQDRDNSCS